MRKHFIVILLALLLVLPLTSAQDDDNLQQENFLMTFIPNIQFSPLYVGVANGYFEQVGLELNIEYLNEPDVIDLVASGRAPIGIVSGEQVILAASQGRPVVYVYEWFQQYPVGVVVAADSAIETPQDLQDQRIGLPGRFGASYSGLVTLLQAAGLSEEAVQLDEIGFNAPDVFCLGVLDAATIYVNNEPLQIRNRAQAGECGDVTDVRVLSVSDYADLVSNGLVTSRDLLETDPQLVRDMVWAYDGGLRAVISNPARAYLLSAPFIDGLPLPSDLRQALEELATEQDTFLITNPTREAIAESRQAMRETLLAQFESDLLTQFDVLLATIELWDADQLGYTDLESWQAMQETLVMLGTLDADDAVDLQQLYTNDYLPERD